MHPVGNPLQYVTFVVLVVKLDRNKGFRLNNVWMLQVPCGLTACTLRSVPGPTLGNVYGRTLLFFFNLPTIAQLSQRKSVMPPLDYSLYAALLWHIVPFII